MLSYVWLFPEILKFVGKLVPIYRALAYEAQQYPENQNHFLLSILYLLVLEIECHSFFVHHNTFFELKKKKEN